MEEQGAITSPQVDPAQGQSTTEAATPSEATPKVEATQPVASTEVDTTYDSTKIPAKFVGKSIEDVVKAYVEVEKEKGRLSNKVSEAEKQTKDLEAKLFQIQSTTLKPDQPVVHSTQTKTIEDLYAEEWEQDPKQAVINYEKRKEARDFVRNNEAQANSFYHQAMTGKLQGYEDFPELEPTMKALVPQVIDVVHPSMISHPKTLQLLHLVARGLNIDKVAEGKAKAIAAKTEEKRNAFAESSSAPTEMVDWSKLTTEQMRKLLPKANRTDY